MSYEDLELVFALAKPEFTSWTPAQREAFDRWDTLERQRGLLFLPTGKGKTLSSLAMIAERGYDRVVVIAPPRTHPDWNNDAHLAGLKPLIMSHQKFRMKSTQLPRNVPIIVDEFHMLGKHGAAGYTKLERMSGKFPAILLCSATPNYNDAERVYCVGRILEPEAYKGGYMKWVYANCNTHVNPFATMPLVDEHHPFLQYDGATDFLSSQYWCMWMEDTATWEPRELALKSDADLDLLFRYGVDRVNTRLMASDMEKRHVVKRRIHLTEDEQYVRPEVFVGLEQWLQAQEDGKILIFSASKTIAKALQQSLTLRGHESYLITGDSTPDQAEDHRVFFVSTRNQRALLIGTASLATGVDGIDKVSNHLLIFDDTDDNTKRRQLIGRVLPRGTLERDTIVTSVDTRV